MLQLRELPTSGLGLWGQGSRGEACARHLHWSLVGSSFPGKTVGQWAGPAEVPVKHQLS